MLSKRQERVGKTEKMTGDKVLLFYHKGAKAFMLPLSKACFDRNVGVKPFSLFLM
jgi:hypothetical protein